MNLNKKIKSIFQSLSSWQVVVYSILCTVLITGLATSLVSLWLWNEIHPDLIVLGTINAILVPLIILPFILGALQKNAKLEEQTQIGSAVQQRADEMSLLYQLGISLASGKDLYETLLILQRGVLKLVQADSLFVAIYDENSDLINYPIFFEGGQLSKHPSRNLGENPGLTGPVVYNKKTLYLSNFRSREALNQYTPVDDNDLALHSFLGIPLMVNERVIGVLSVQGNKIDAYSAEQVHLMENIAVQAALAIDKAGLLEQLQDELEERKRVEAGLHERDAILEAITIAAEEFLKTSDWRTHIDMVLETLGVTIRASHVYLFEHHIGVDKKMVASMHYEWTAPGCDSDLNDPHYQNKPIHKEGMDEASDLLQQGEAFIANASLFPDSEQERMSEIGVKALLEMPLLVNGQWWGTIGFDDMVQERTWSASEVDALKIAAGILSAAIQRQKADSALQESERIYRRAIEAADAVPYYQEYSQDGYLFIGEGIREMTGYSPQEINWEVWVDITEERVMLGEAEGLSFDEAFQLVRQGRIKSWKCDQKIRTRDGQVRWITDRSIELFTDKNISYGSIGILQDITERKQMEQALIFSEEKFSKAFHTTPVMMTIDDADGLFIEVNKAFIDGTGFSRENIIGHRASELNMWDSQDDKNKIQQLLTEQGGFKDIELTYRRKSGKTAVVLMSSEKFHVDNVVYTLTSALDITERKLVEAEREKLIDELEAKNEELERFTYTVSHDLKSPLVTINGFLGYLEHDAVSGNMERMKKDILRIQESVDKMERLLNELLALSRVGRMINAPSSFPFQELVSEAAEIVYGRLQARGITVEVSPEAGLQVIYGDKPRLIEAMQNVLENAAKYMGDQPNPHIEAGQAGEEDEMPIYHVRDNGIGIAPEYHERIFGLFNKLDPTTEGTGVGLALVKRIIEIHGGRIWVESEEGQGATFYFTLPRPPKG